MKVETHNHPTAISPFPGAATGSGGEIRDEGATGRGGKPKAGLAGFSVSNLRIPGLRAAVGARLRPAGAHRLGARHHDRRPDRRGRIQQRVRPPEHPRLLPHVRDRRSTSGVRAALRGYHKPIMIAGGLGNVRRMHVEKSRRAARREDHRARRSGDADRSRRRRGFLGRQRRERGGSRFRLRAARQSRDPAARAGSHRSVLGAGRRRIRSC